jgi:hypothetical protein
MRITVYLTDNVVHDAFGRPHSFPKERLIRQSATDRVLAIIEAPRGSRIRQRPDMHGSDQLLVPIRTGLWQRWFGPKYVIPAKYLIQEARFGVKGLRLVQYRNGAASLASVPLSTRCLDPSDPTSALASMGPAPVDFDLSPQESGPGIRINGSLCGEHGDLTR